MAKKFGDDTAERAGRLTLNPSVHISPMGTIVLPLMLVIFGFTAFGYANPVPIDSRNFKNYKKGLFFVSFAGPLSNIVLGIVSAAIYALVAINMEQAGGYQAITLQILTFSIFINFLLAFFNLLPIPPFDGSKMASIFMPEATARQYLALERFTPILFLIIIFLSFQIEGFSAFNFLYEFVNTISGAFTYFFLRLFS